jgi:hypothetical protein
MLYVVLDTIELVVGGTGATDGGRGGCSSCKDESGCRLVSHCEKESEKLVVGSRVVEMMLHPIANTIYELPMGSDEIVDWHEIDPIFCWVESILLVMHKQHLVHLQIRVDLAFVANVRTDSYVDICTLLKVSHHDSGSDVNDRMIPICTGWLKKITFT